MKNLAREFLERLDQEERTFSDQLQGDELGVMFFTAIKEFDFYYYNLMRHEASEEAEHQFHLIRLGIPKVISKVLSGIKQFRHPTIIFRSSPPMIFGALEAIAAFGMIEQGRRLAHGVMADECEICRIDNRSYDIILPDIMTNFEQYESLVERHYTRIQAEKSDKSVKEMIEKEGFSTLVESLLENNVYVFREHFIGYDAHPDIDDFFFGKAALALQAQSGYDTFSYRLEFGGISFLKYILATIYFLSLSLKHEKFAAALVNKQRQIDLRDILTITCEKDAFRKCLIEALNMYGPSYHGYSTIDEYEADIILNVLSLRRDNLGVIDGVMSPLPFLIEFSETAWVKSIAAPQLGSMDFLLHSLRYNFPKDYERHQQTRESSMQRAVRRILDDAIPGLTYRDNIRIRRDGRTITDIDFMAAEEASGTIILFQLKHQDHYRADMRKRSSRAKHLKEKCASWLAAVREWLSLSSHKELRSALQLKSGFVPRRICIVLLTRHFAHFLGTLDLQTDAVYATWMQFYDALNRIGVEGRERSLLSLFEVLQAFMTHKMDPGHKVEIDDYYHLSGLSYRIRPRGASVES